MRPEEVDEGVTCVPCEEVWDAFCAMQRGDTGLPYTQPRRPQPIIQVGSNPGFEGHVQLAFPSHWWRIEDLELVQVDELGEIVAGTYLHKKGGRYRVIQTSVVNEADLKPMVVYISLKDGKVWCRPESSWLEPVPWPDGAWRPRFLKVAF